MELNGIEARDPKDWTKGSTFKALAGAGEEGEQQPSPQGAVSVRGRAHI